MASYLEALWKYTGNLLFLGSEGLQPEPKVDPIEKHVLLPPVRAEQSDMVPVHNRDYIYFEDIPGKSLEIILGVCAQLAKHKQPHEIVLDLDEESAVSVLFGAYFLAVEPLVELCVTYIAKHIHSYDMRFDVVPDEIISRIANKLSDKDLCLVDSQPNNINCESSEYWKPFTEEVWRERCKSRWPNGGRWIPEGQDDSFPKEKSEESAEGTGAPVLYSRWWATALSLKKWWGYYARNAPNIKDALEWKRGWWKLYFVTNRFQDLVMEYFAHGTSSPHPPALLQEMWDLVDAGGDCIFAVQLAANTYMSLGKALDGELGKMLQKLQSLRKLRLVQSRHRGISEDPLCKYLRDIIRRNPNLQSLVLTASSIAIQQLQSALFTAQSLSHLSIVVKSGATPSQADLKALYDVLRANRSIKALEIVEAGLGDSQCAELASVLSRRGSNSLLYLNARGNNAEDAGGMALEKMLRGQRELRYLLLGHNYLGKANFPLVKTLSNCHKHLSHLDLSYNPLDQRSVSAIASLISTAGNSLVHLNLECCAVDSAGAIPLTNAIRSAHSGLLWLNVSNNFIGTEGLVCLAKVLQDDDRLICLNLDSSQLRKKKCITVIMESLKNNYTLTSLSLKNNDIQSEELQLIADFLNKNQVLTVLDLSKNPLGEKGAASMLQWFKSVDPQPSASSTDSPIQTTVEPTPLMCPDSPGLLDLNSECPSPVMGEMVMAYNVLDAHGNTLTIRSNGKITRNDDVFHY